MEKTLGNNIYDWLIDLGLKHNNAVLIKGMIIVIGLLILSYIVFKVIVFFIGLRYGLHTGNHDRVNNVIV